jgi:hypothetical protein
MDKVNRKEDLYAKESISAFGAEKQMSGHCTGKRDDEVFVGNTDTTLGEHLASLKTIRLGEVALDVNGNRLPPRYRPIFVGRSEADAYDRIMMARLSAINRGSND